MTEDEMVGWHHRLNEHEFEQALGVGDGQGSLVCCSPWGRKESDTTEGTQHNSISAVQLLSCDPMDCSTPGLPVHHQLLELLQFMFIKSVMPSNHLILCRPLLLPPSIFPSIRVFSNESVLCIKWPKYWSFSFSISLSNEYLGLISFRMDWLDLLTVQGMLKSVLQNHI